MTGYRPADIAGALPDICRACDNNPMLCGRPGNDKQCWKYTPRLSAKARAWQRRKA